jgi:putative (di)nucleoside polyphosphate hydrolase
VSDIAPSAEQYRSGTGIMLLNHRGRALIGRRNDIEGGAWQMPQGGLGRGEDPRIGALRELKEEIGTDSATILAESKDWHQYELPYALWGRAWGGKYLGQRQKWFLMRFTGCDEDINLEMPNPEFNRWLWVPPHDLPDLVVSFKRPLYEAVLAEFKPLLQSIQRGNSA